MHQDNIHLEKDKVISGIAKATSMIRGCYGAGGGNVLVQHQLYPFHIITNDGKQIVDSIKLADPIENMGAGIMREAGDKAEKDSGDGRKTTMILTEAILNETKDSKLFPIEIFNSLNECIPLIHAEIDRQKQEMSVDRVGAVATISSENEEIGRMIQEIYQQIGKDGIIEVDNSNLPETFYEITEGVRLRNARYFGEYSITDFDTRKAVFKNPKILITKDKITSVDQIDPLIGALKSNSINELVIYCEDIDLTVASRLALTHMQGGFKTLLIKAPTLWKDWLYEDFTKMTGATAVDAKVGKTFKNFTLADLGTCDKIITSNEETRVIGIKDISDHLAYLDSLNTDDAKVRKTWLQTKVAVLKVGANSESEIFYRTKKARDAASASYLALKDGVVAGGGWALHKCIEVLPDTIGGNILKKVLDEPMKQVMENMGITELALDEKVIDPSLVVKNAIKNAISIASTVLTLKGVTIISYDEDQKSMRRMQ